MNYLCIMSGCRSPLDGTIICLAVFNVGRNAKNEVVSFNSALFDDRYRAYQKKILMLYNTQLAEGVNNYEYNPQNVTLPSFGCPK